MNNAQKEMISESFPSETAPMMAGVGDKERFCAECGTVIMRWRIIKQEKSCIFLKIKLCCAKDRHFDTFELKVPIINTNSSTS
jgi:hypothetical protein